MLYAVGRRSGGGRVCLIRFNAFRGREEREKERNSHRLKPSRRAVLSRFRHFVQRVSVRNRLRAPPRETEGLGLTSILPPNRFDDSVK